MSAMQQDQVARELAERLADELGDGLSGPWRQAFLDTPRHLFIPDRALWNARIGKTEIDRNNDPDDWLAKVYTDESIITQFDDGTDSGKGNYTSSCSMPSIVFIMLNHLDAQPGMRALEIGAGTGWNAALLAHQLGTDNVTTIDIDPDIAQQAQANLTTINRPATVITGDGANGHPPRAPYDRIIATCSVSTIPYAWIEQTRPGGIIITPWGPPLADEYLLRLEVGDNGEATGTLVNSALFMRMRSQREQVTDEPDDFDDIATRSTTDLNPRDVLADHPLLVVALHLGECLMSYNDDPEADTLWLIGNDAWASVANGKVRQAGTRNLWDEAVAAYQWWCDHGQPHPSQIHLTVTRDHQWVWLDDPTNIITDLASDQGKCI